MAKSGLVFAVVLVVFFLGCVSDDLGGGAASAPKPAVVKGSYSEGYDYTSNGLITGVRVGVDVVNSGAEGDVYVSVSSLGGGYNASKVFSMGEGEAVSVRAYFSTAPKRSFSQIFTWTARPASADDVSEGDVTVASKNQ